MIFSELKKISEPKQDEPWFENIPDYNKKIFERLKQVAAMQSNINYLKSLGVSEESLENEYRAIYPNYKKKKPTENKFNPVTFQLYQILTEKDPELAKFLFHGMVFNHIRNYDSD